MEVAVLVLMAIIVGALIYTLLRLGKSDYNYLADRMAKKSRDGLEVLKPCPLCRTMLRRGETVHSVVFSGPAHAENLDRMTAAARSVGPSSRTAGAVRGGSGGRVEDHLAHIFGCRYCYPANQEHPRICPVCAQTLRPDGYLIARMFEKPGKKHVHVLGCTECRNVRVARG